jgi:hypothetical protein
VVAVAMAAMAALPAAAQARGGQFKVNCTYSHSATDDPIVFPGQPGASHLHDFFGNTTTDAFSTAATLLAGGTTCETSDDKSGYWEPALYSHGVRTLGLRLATYYVGNANTEPVPAGLKMVAGDSHATGIQPATVILWSCGNGTPQQTKPYDCSSWLNVSPLGVTGLVRFPMCWDGTGLDRGDVVYKGAGGRCPAAFPHLIPQLRVFLKTGIVNPFNRDGIIAISFSSGPWYTIHADFFNGWTQSRMVSLTKNCLNAGKSCGVVP